MIEWLRARAAARRLGLRDKGKIQPLIEEGEEMVMLCDLCNARLRIGIEDDSGLAFQYCHVCEEVHDDDWYPSDPGEGEPIPEAIPEDDSRKVVPFRKKA